MPAVKLMVWCVVAFFGAGALWFVVMTAARLRPAAGAAARWLSQCRRAWWRPAKRRWLREQFDPVKPRIVFPEAKAFFVSRRLGKSQSEDIRK